LRQTAERVFKQKCNSKSQIETYFVGHGPFGFYSHTYPSDVQKKLNTFGSKVFFYYSYYINGNVTLHENLVDYAWVTKDELSSYFHENYHHEVRQIIPDDGKHELLSREMPNYAEPPRKKEK